MNSTPLLKNTCLLFLLLDGTYYFSKIYIYNYMLLESTL